MSHKVLTLYSLFGFLFLFNSADSLEIFEMTLEEEVGQLFIVYFDGEELNDNSTRLIRDVKIE